MESRSAQNAFYRVLDAKDGAFTDGPIDPEALWLQIKIDLAPISDLLVCDFHEYPSGAWVLKAHVSSLASEPFNGLTNSESWHDFLKTKLQSTLAEWYLPHQGILLLAIPGRPPTSVSVPTAEQDVVLLVERARHIIERRQVVVVAEFRKGWS
jgi:hypothetical protein